MVHLINTITILYTFMIYSNSDPSHYDLIIHVCNAKKKNKAKYSKQHFKHRILHVHDLHSCIIVLTMQKVVKYRVYVRVQVFCNTRAEIKYFLQNS